MHRTALILGLVLSSGAALGEEPALRCKLREGSGPFRELSLQRQLDGKQYLARFRLSARAWRALPLTCLARVVPQGAQEGEMTFFASGEGQMEGGGGFYGADGTARLDFAQDDGDAFALVRCAGKVQIAGYYRCEP